MNRPLQSRRRRQHGIAAVEFAFSCVILFSFLFGVVEIARLSFLWNSLMQATSTAARGAAVAPFNAAKLDLVRQNAIFVTNGTDAMPMTDNIRYDSLQIDYLNANRQLVTSLPSCQIENVTNCAANPNGASCVKFVRVRLCQIGSGSNCAHVPYQPLIPLPAMTGLNIDIPWFTTIVPLEAQALPGDCT